MEAPLRPDHTIELNLNGRFRTAEHARGSGQGIMIRDEITVSTGTYADYQVLAPFHYRYGHEQEQDWSDVLLEVRVSRYRGEVVATRLYALPFSRALERLPIFADLNRAIVVQERTVVHPAFRSIGLARMLGPTCLDTQRLVFVHSALGRLVPFHLREGFEPVDHPSREPLPSQLRMLESLLRVDPNVNPNSVDSVLRAVSAATPTQRVSMLTLAQDAFVDMNVRFVGFMAELAGRATSLAELEDVRSTFRAVTSDVDAHDIETCAVMVEACAPFEVAGFVKRLESERTCS